MGLRDSGLGPEADTLLSPGSQLCDHSQVGGGAAGRGAGKWKRGHLRWSSANTDPGQNSREGSQEQGWACLQAP